MGEPNGHMVEWDKIVRGARVKLLSPRHGAALGMLGHVGAAGDVMLIQSSRSDLNRIDTCRSRRHTAG
jgi:hypothetical protein